MSAKTEAGTLRHAADGDVPLAVAGLAADDEGVGQDHRRVPAGRVARSARTRSMAAPSTAAWPTRAAPSSAAVSAGSR